MKFYIGTDHAGYKIKAKVIEILKQNECEVEDLGCKSNQKVDYPDYGRKVAQAVAKNKGSFGIVICGTGIGISVSANKVRGIRAALCHDTYTATMARAHNDANILAFGERVVGFGVVEDMIKAFLKTPFEGGRHKIRVAKIEAV